jgi:hypothetical protein
MPVYWEEEPQNEHIKTEKRRGKERKHKKGIGKDPFR